MADVTVLHCMRRFEPDELPSKVYGALFDISTRMQADTDRVRPTHGPALLLLLLPPRCAFARDLYVKHSTKCWLQQHAVRRGLR